MRHQLRIDADGKAYRKRYHIDYSIDNLIVVPDASDPSLMNISFTLTLSKTFTYITTTFVI